jgi:radical SAM superfamily enzyme YgiQ (UPF0313 family)
MKVMLVSPSAYPEIKAHGGLMIPQLALHILEGLTPPEHEITTVEEEISVVDLDAECDVVGISFMTSNAPRAYELAGEFRRRGKKVILGGIHPTILPDEAAQYADSVVVGEAEGVWERVLDDCKNDRLKPRYHEGAVSLDRYIPMGGRRVGKRQAFNAVPVMTTRGCPYSCDFCCVSEIYGKKIRHVPIENVVRGIEEADANMYIFLDDNIIGDPRYAKELFRAIKPLKIKWGGQASISFVHDAELMQLAADSGCVALFFGLESVSEIQMKRMRKSVKDIAQLGEAIRKIRGMGIHFHASFVFGFDDDTPDVFPETLDFMLKNKIGSASLNILTPYPGTRVYNQFKTEGRLISENWKYYDHSTAVYRPKNMTPYELQTGLIKAKKEFSSFGSIFARFPWNMAHPLIFLGSNLAARTNAANDQSKLAGLVKEVFNQSLAEPHILELRPALQA